MPTYQYACTNADCGHRFERVQAFTDPAVTSCPDCEERVRKVYGSVGVVFKGSGFYRNDSRDAKSSAAASAKSADSGAGGEPKTAAATKDAKDGSTKDGPAKESKADSTSSAAKSEKSDGAAPKPARAAAAS